MEWWLLESVKVHDLELDKDRAGGQMLRNGLRRCRERSSVEMYCVVDVVMV